eukprot:TRINITY_DN34595_c0_g1_i1.p1 TRINITY_DN34595_c0_g1~~TRINITY_DN34595_c0_g1_i1.p1  ORF type:complete len:254 (+),score=43.24 TRINITY_DN34595_c0_g1_i1:345-1106(+)
MGCSVVKAPPFCWGDPDEPSAGSLDAPRFPERILDANAYVEREYQGMVGAHHRLKALAQAQEATLKSFGAPLIQDCKSIHDDLVSLAARQPACKEAQESMLPKLFEQSARHGGAIDGCVVARPNGVSVSTPCECTSGSMAAGCRDADDDGDHQLLCTHLRENGLSKRELHKLFAPGQTCSIDRKSVWNGDLLPTDEPTAFKMPGVSDPALACLPAPLAVVSAVCSMSPAPSPADEGRRKRRGARAAAAGRSFL